MPPAMAKKRRSGAGADPSSTKKSRSIEEFAKDDNGGIFTAAQQCIRQFQEWTSGPFLIETLRQQKVQEHGNLSQYFSDKFNNKEARD